MHMKINKLQLDTRCIVTIQLSPKLEGESRHDGIERKWKVMKRVVGAAVLEGTMFARHRPGCVRGQL